MPTSVTAAVVAHQGGWDEALFVAVPMLVLVALLALAQHRAGAEQDRAAQHADEATRSDVDER